MWQHCAVSHTRTLSTSYPGSFTYARRSGKDPGWSWSREPPDFRGKSNLRLFATKGGVVEERTRFSCLRITTFRPSANGPKRL